MSNSLNGPRHTACAEQGAGFHEQLYLVFQAGNTLIPDQKLLLLT